MRTWRIPALRRALPLLLVLSLLLIAVAGANAGEVRYDGVDILPIYARIAAGEILHNDVWTVVVFYRPPECVPSSFNLLAGYDWENAFYCGPMTVDGFIVWEEPWLQPLLINLHGLGAVPVWFVEWDEMETAIADGVLTVGELAGMSTLLEGSASNYQELLQPTSESDYGMIEYNAKGQLQDGRSFKVHVLVNSPDGMLVTIQLK